MRVMTVCLRCVLVTAIVALPGWVGAQSELPSLSAQCPSGAVPKVDTSTVSIGIWPSATWRARNYGTAQQLRMR